MKMSKAWTKPELKQLSVEQTLGGTVPNFNEDRSFTDGSDTVFGEDPVPGS